MENIKAVNYKKIYSDILSQKFPEKIFLCHKLLEKKELSSLDIIVLNDLIFRKINNKESHNEKYRSYNKSTIFEILDYQKKNKLNNTELANHFKMSRNTIAKWKKIFH